MKGLMRERIRKSPEEIESNAAASIRLEGGEVPEAARALVLRRLRGELTSEQVREIFVASRGILPQPGAKRPKGYVALTPRNST